MVIDWVEEMNAKLGIPEKLRDILTVRNEATDEHITIKYHHSHHDKGILTEDQLVELAFKAERNDTGFTNFIRFNHHDYARVLRECL